MESDYVEYNGVRVVRGWPELIRQAQAVTVFTIDGAEVPRIRYGAEAEDWGANAGPCHDCAVVKGQYHVLHCDVERCPACGGQAFGCDCEYDDEA